MAVQIPSVDRFPVQQEASVGRVDYKPADAVQPMEVQAKAAEGLAGAGAEAAVSQIYASAKLAGTQASTDYHMWYEDRLNQAKEWKGDPAEAYSKLEEDAALKKAEIATKYRGTFSETEAMVNRGLKETDVKFYDRISTAKAVQGAKFAGETTDKGVAISQQDAADAAAHGFKRDDPHAFVGFQGAMDKIYDQRITQFLKDGRAKEIRDENGNVKGYDLLPSAKIQLAKDNEKAVVDTIGVLSSAGKIEDAEYLKEKYGQYISAHSEPKIAERTLKDKIHYEANNLAVKVQGMDDAKAAEYINTHTDDPDVKKKAMSNLASLRSEMNRLTAMNEKKNFNVAWTRILEANKAGKPFADGNAMENDSVIRQLIDQKLITPKMRQDLRHQVEQPRDSDPEARRRVFEALISPHGLKMSTEDWISTSSGLNKSDKAKYDNIWQRANSQTNAQEAQTISRMSSQLTKELNVLGYVKKDGYNKYSNEDQNRITKAIDQMIDAAEQFPPNLSPDAQSKWVQKFAAEQIKEGKKFSLEKGDPLLRGGGFKATTRPSAPVSNQPVNVQAAPAPSDAQLLEQAIKVWHTNNPGKPQDFKFEPGSPETVELFKIRQSLKNK